MLCTLFDIILYCNYWHFVRWHQIRVLQSKLLPISVTIFAIPINHRHSDYCSCLLVIKPTRCTNFSNLFLEWNSTCFGQCLRPSSGVFHCTHSNGISHTVSRTACEQDQDGTEFHPNPAHKLSANMYDLYHCCVYSEKLLMMDRGTVRNM
jgi:hypothetical protein